MNNCTSESLNKIQAIILNLESGVVVYVSGNKTLFNWFEPPFFFPQVNISQEKIKLYLDFNCTLSLFVFKRQLDEIPPEEGEDND